MSVADEIKARLTMSEVFRGYGLNPDSRGKLCCPFHNEKTPSLGVYRNGKRFHCFGCGADGDAITFTMRYFGLGFNEALRRLNEDFSLGLIKAGHTTRRDMLKAIEAARERKEARRKREEAAEKLTTAYWEAFDRWKGYDDALRLYKPMSASEELHPLFIEALQNIAYAAYILSIRDEERNHFEKCQTV